MPVKTVAVLLALLCFGSAPAAAQDFFDSVVQRAREAAAQSYRREAAVPDARSVGYDAYRAIRTRREAVLWWNADSLFRVEFFPTGFLYEQPVKINVVSGATSGNAGAVRTIEPQADMFDFDRFPAPKSFALAGFKVTYPLQGEKYDEVLSFLGASYFRQLGRGQVYGASARGLAIDTAQPNAEEFPEFREFWLVEPAPNDHTLTIYALLDSPGAAGAFRFLLQPGARTIVDVEARLFPRHAITVLGVAPLTSMFLGGKAGPPRDDFRPEVHDSDGLAMLTSGGERIWRPLSNPSALAISSFFDKNPRGFGLLQRERRFDQYQDTSANYHARPSLWVEPQGDWGEGEVRLIEIPTPSEVHDNIVAFWKPGGAVTKDKPLHFRYRLWALKDEMPLPGETARIVAVRHAPLELQREEGQQQAQKGRRVVVEFEGGELPTLGADQPVESDVEVSGGRVLRTFVDRTPDGTNRRLFIDIEPEGRRPADIKAAITLRGLRLSETLNYVLRP
jgi:glucans biosynthesis protein